MDPIPTKQCYKCHVTKPLTAFSKRQRDSKDAKKGEPTNKCSACMELERQAQAQARGRKRTARMASHDDKDDDTDEASTQPIIDLVEFIDRASVGLRGNAFSMTARVDCVAHLSASEAEPNALEVAEIIGEQTLMRWWYVITRF